MLGKVTNNRGGAKSNKQKKNQTNRLELELELEVEVEVELGFRSRYVHSFDRDVSNRAIKRIPPKHLQNYGLFFGDTLRFRTCQEWLRER